MAEAAGKVLIFKLKADTRYSNGCTFISSRVEDVYEQIANALDGLSMTSLADEPVTITIAGGSDLVEQGTLTISRGEMTQEELDALPEFDGF